MRGKYMVNYIITKDSYGDWCVPPESPLLIHSKDSSRITEPKLLATAYLLSHAPVNAALCQNGKQNQ